MQNPDELIEQYQLAKIGRIHRMTFDEWWEDFVAEHDEWKYADSAALRRAAFQAGAASRDAEVQRLQMALADAEALELGTAEKCNQLRTELVKALAACKAKDEAILQENYSLALSFQPDDSALKTWLGEPVAEVDDSGVVIVCRYDYKPKDKLYSPKGLK